MKLIQQSKLFYREGKSDKVYEIDLCQLSENEFLVNFRYGRRGSTLKEGTKTASALSKEKADLLFADLENEKRKKGYQTETELFIELPSLDAVVPDSINGTILQRLQDAVLGQNSFKTGWKTSRVIWKAGILDIQEAIPFIIKLATRGDDMQTYASLWSLVKLKAISATSLFSAIASNVKQKNHIINLACEGLLTLGSEEEIVYLTRVLLEKLPEEIRYAIEIKDLDLLRDCLVQNTKEKEVGYVSNLYVLAKVQPETLPIINEILRGWEFKPPFFKHIRAIYKLAQLRNDATTIAILAYGFEKQKAMFKRTAPLHSNYKQYLTVIDQNVRVGAELKHEDSKLAFSHFTKHYFQKNALAFLKHSGLSFSASTYLKLAVNILLQYREKDYSLAEERPFNIYGNYDYQTKKYSYLLVKYPECADSLLLSTILFGNDSTRKLQPNMRFIVSSKTVVSKHYVYDEGQVEEFVASKGNYSGNIGNSVIDTAKSIFRNLFGKKNTPVDSAPEAVHPTEISEKPGNEHSRFELFPEHWDAMPEAYVQLLMQSQMSRIHVFAYNGLKAHPKYGEIIKRFNQPTILQLLNSNFELPRKFGFEILKDKAEEFLQDPSFIAEVIGSNSLEARKWAQEMVDLDPKLYYETFDFILLLIFNVRDDSSLWINESLQNYSFSDERIQAILGKVISEILHLENTENNNHKAKTAISRLSTLAEREMERISWTIVEQLISSVLDANKILAGRILLLKSRKVDSTEIPGSLTELFLLDELQEVRQIGVELLHQYPDDFVVKNIDLLHNLIDSHYNEVSVAVFGVIKKLIISYSELGNIVIPYFVYALRRKEKFDGAHIRISEFLLHDLKSYWNTGLQPKDITKLLHGQYRICHLSGYEILKAYDHPEAFSLKQIISFGNHEILAIRQWCWNYFKQNVDRIHAEKDQSLYLLDSKWDDSRAFAFHFFKTEFTETDWDADTLIAIVDSIKPDVESFGKEMISRYFNPDHAIDYLTKLSEHPSLNVQAFVSSYLSMYAKDSPNLQQELTFYFRSVLTRVNKGRVAKDRIFSFLYNESLKNIETASWIVGILDDVSAQTTIQDKASCIDILTKIKTHYPELDMHLMIKN